MSECLALANVGHDGCTPRLCNAWGALEKQNLKCLRVDGEASF